MSSPIFALCFCPLIAAALLSWASWRLPLKISAFISITTTALSHYTAWVIFLFINSQTENHQITTWIQPFIHADPIHIDITLTADWISAIFAIMVTLVSLFVQIYATDYFTKPTEAAWFYTLVSAFTSCMLLLICADHLWLLFAAWEGVGLCSYALIGFYAHHKPNTESAKQALILNRIGDACLLAAVVWLYHAGYTVHLRDLLNPTWLKPQDAEIVLMLVWVAVAAKSAQIPLYIWLPQAMCGPTPASALIHAATMVTAGVYLSCRLSGLIAMAPVAQSIWLFSGGLTSLLAAWYACGARDCKEVLAFSTISQLGYMIMACGAQAPHLALFHLLTHASFKAALFLIAGRSIHHAHGEQNLFKLGASNASLPLNITLSALFAVASMTGVPGFAGFVSKDAILLHLAQYTLSSSTLALAHPMFPAFAWVAGTCTVGLTAFYMWRWFFLLFAPQDVLKNQKEASKEVSIGMDIPIGLLSAIGLFAGLLNWPESWGGNAWLTQHFGFRPLILEHSAYHLMQELAVTLINLFLLAFGCSLAWRWNQHNSFIFDIGKHALQGLYHICATSIYPACVFFLYVIGERTLLRWGEHALRTSIGLLGFAGQWLQNGRLQRGLSLATTTTVLFLYWYSR